MPATVALSFLVSILLLAAVFIGFTVLLPELLHLTSHLPTAASIPGVRHGDYVLGLSAVQGIISALRTS